MARLDLVVDALDSPLGHPAGVAVDPLVKAGKARSNTTEGEYKAMVARAKDYIAAGDAFQIVLSQRFTSQFDLPPFALYRALSRINPTPDSGYSISAASPWSAPAPKSWCGVRDGNRHPPDRRHPPARKPAEDEALAAEPLADPKERAEHLMLLDLGRNDVGRVAKLGTVKVTDSFFIERYSHVMHIVSNVEGELRDAVDAIAALVAGFPAGTVSGAPKVRAMQIIDELENDKRGIYAGCIGYFAADGAMDTCIVLRTAVVKDGPDVRAGRRRHRRRFVPRHRADRMRRQGARPTPRGGGSGAVRGSGQARTVGAVVERLRRGQTLRGAHGRRRLPCDPNHRRGGEAALCSRDCQPSVMRDLHLTHSIRSARFHSITGEDPMFIRKIAHASAFAGTVGISLWASAASSQPQAPVEHEAKYAPISEHPL